MDTRPTLVKIYGSKVFRESVIRQRLAKSVYQSFLKTIERGQPLDVSIAPQVSRAMMEWAIEQGATHYAHWFVPMTNMTACKHDAFLNPTAIGEANLEFPEKTLVKGEPDASAFPSGGLRATFEARGYTTWDPTSPAFVRDGTLFIPSVFTSYNGEALDLKVPLLRSIEALDKASVRFLTFFASTKGSLHVETSVGAEQEYFLIDRAAYEKREDLKLCGRTLLGASPPKGQQLDDHYMGRIRIRIADFMKELDRQLWELGIPAKTKHNEVAPAQHELAPVFETANIASDHNQMVMELMRTIAKTKGLACLLHEKPFKGVNGSGKHNNYSIMTDTGVNLFSPHAFSEDEGLFNLMICAVIRSVDLYAGLLRSTTAGASNEHRLGGFEAPPAILTIFLGETILNDLLKAARGEMHSSDSHDSIRSIVPSLPELQIDDSDRNRTTPMAFTGNKFEFRQLGSSQSIAHCNTVLNTIVADSLDEFATRLEHAEDLTAEKTLIIKDTLKKHGRVIFNGNNYSDEWLAEANKRGLLNVDNTIDALAALVTEESIALFSKYGVYTREECVARHDVFLESYIKTISIEASTLVDIVKRQVLPAITHNAGRLAKSYVNLKTAGFDNKELFTKIDLFNTAISTISKSVSELEAALNAIPKCEGNNAVACYIRDIIMKHMDTVRKSCDEVEAITDPSSWPFPTYYSILYGI